MLKSAFHLNQWIINTSYGEDVKTSKSDVPSELNGFEKQIKQVFTDIEKKLQVNHSNKHSKLLQSKYGSTRLLGYDKDRNILDKNTLSSPRDKLSMSYNDRGASINKFKQKHDDSGQDLRVDTDILSPRTKIKEGLLP